MIETENKENCPSFSNNISKSLFFSYKKHEKTFILDKSSIECEKNSMEMAKIQKNEFILEEYPLTTSFFFKKKTKINEKSIF